MSALVFAAAPYSNSAPLVDGLGTVDPPVRVVYGHPSGHADALLAGRVDCALVPVAHGLAHPELTMLDRVGVAVDGVGRSVLLKCHKPMEQIRRVARDPASGTSNALAELLLERHFGRAPEMVDHPAAADAEVMIGDSALLADPAPGGDIDLAQAWKEMTGLPFVFAVWTLRSDCAERAAIEQIAEQAATAGQAAINQIAKRFADQTGRAAAFWADYLQHAIHFNLTDADRKGIDAFRSMLAMPEYPTLMADAPEHQESSRLDYGASKRRFLTAIHNARRTMKSE